YDKSSYIVPAPDTKFHDKLYSSLYILGHIHNDNQRIVCSTLSHYLNALTYMTPQWGITFAPFANLIACEFSRISLASMSYLKKKIAPVEIGASVLFSNGAGATGQGDKVWGEPGYSFGPKECKKPPVTRGRDASSSQWMEQTSSMSNLHCLVWQLASFPCFLAGTWISHTSTAATPVGTAGDSSVRLSRVVMLSLLVDDLIREYRRRESGTSVKKEGEEECSLCGVNVKVSASPIHKVPLHLPSLLQISSALANCITDSIEYSFSVSHKTPRRFHRRFSDPGMSYAMSHWKRIVQAKGGDVDAITVADLGTGSVRGDLEKYSKLMGCWKLLKGLGVRVMRSTMKLIVGDISAALSESKKFSQLSGLQNLLKKEEEDETYEDVVLERARFEEDMRKSNPTKLAESKKKSEPSIADEKASEAKPTPEEINTDISRLDVSLPTIGDDVSAPVSPIPSPRGSERDPEVPKLESGIPAIPSLSSIQRILSPLSLSILARNYSNIRQALVYKFYEIYNGTRSHKILSIDAFKAFSAIVVAFFQLSVDCLQSGCIGHKDRFKAGSLSNECVIHRALTDAHAVGSKVQSMSDVSSERYYIDDTLRKVMYVINSWKDGDDQLNPSSSPWSSMLGRRSDFVDPDKLIAIEDCISDVGLDYKEVIKTNESFHSRVVETVLPVLPQMRQILISSGQLLQEHLSFEINPELFRVFSHSDDCPSCPLSRDLMLSSQDLCCVHGIRKCVALGKNLDIYAIHDVIMGLASRNEKAVDVRGWTSEIVPSLLSAFYAISLVLFRAYSAAASSDRS
ncbi:hypothetical protein ADUPG1_000038, partial [Aduncisulcus paluster]